MTGLGTPRKGVFNTRSVSRTLIVDKLQEKGHDVMLTKNQPRIFNVKRNAMFILDMWWWILTGQARTGKCLDAVRQR